MEKVISIKDCKYLKSDNSQISMVLVHDDFGEFNYFIDKNHIYSDNELQKEVLLKIEDLEILPCLTTFEEEQKQEEETKKYLESIEYRNLRKYPPVEEQLDMIYHSGFLDGTKWYELITSIKAENPKP